MRSMPHCLYPCISLSLLSEYFGAKSRVNWHVDIFCSDDPTRLRFGLPKEHDYLLLDLFACLRPACAFAMVVRIRFAMHGTRHNKLFHIVAINGKQRRDAKPIETLGIYRHTVNPTKDQMSKSVDWSVARIKYWLDVGAQPSKSAVKLFTQVSTVAQILPNTQLTDYPFFEGRDPASKF